MALFTPKQVRDFKCVTNELLKVIKRIIKCLPDDLNKSSLEENLCFDFGGISYGIYVVNISDWKMEDQCEYQLISYQLVSYDSEKANYPRESKIIDRFNLLLEVIVIRTSFICYYYKYGIPILSLITVKRVPEKIIPTHEEVDFIEIE